MARAGALALLWLLAITQLFGQDARPNPGPFILPVEVSDGFISGRGSPVPLTVSLRAHPSVVPAPSWQLGATLAVSYRNPQVETLGGLRAVVHILQLPQAFHGYAASGGIFAEALYGTHSHQFIYLGGQVDLGGIMQFGLRSGRETRAGETYWEGFLGTDVVSLLRSVLTVPQ